MQASNVYGTDNFHGVHQCWRYHQYLKTDKNDINVVAEAHVQAGIGACQLVTLLKLKNFLFEGCDELFMPDVF